jgi:hypothetical protein
MKRPVLNPAIEQQEASLTDTLPYHDVMSIALLALL